MGEKPADGHRLLPLVGQPQLAPSHWSPDQLEPLQLEPLHELPLHELPDQLEPPQELPDQERLLQLEPLQELPLHELPDQLEPLQELPFQESPVHWEPFHVPPDQLEPCASSTAIRSELNGWPKMSSGPWSTTPPSERWFEPRDASSEPVPNDDRWSCLALRGGESASSAFRSSSPAPCQSFE